MISQEVFAKAFRQMSSYDWSAIPAVITEYDASLQKASVRPLIKQVMRDMSTKEYPVIGGVPVVMPRTAYAGIQLPVAIGDKVILIFMQKSIEKVTHSDLSGTNLTEPIDPKSTRLKDYNDCVALIGFSDFAGSHGTSTSLEIKNNIGKGAQNSIELTESGDINVTGANVNVNATNTTVNSTNSTINTTAFAVNATTATFNCPVTAPNFSTPTVDMNQHRHTSASSGNPSSIPIPV
jgi:hypothetical protein